jgi:hypothetical protein|tara:strand:- start:718 stop:849 length:132 start_codon:yes stop_codon:yes gene_type:complete
MSALKILKIEVIERNKVHQIRYLKVNSFAEYRKKSSLRYWINL